MSQAAVLRPVLEVLSLKLDGSPAPSATTTRKRSALHGAPNYAVEIGELPVNPKDKITWQAPLHTDEADRRVVVNPTQAQALLSAVADIYPSLGAFFACMYSAGLRPSEVRHLREADLNLPADSTSWGSPHLTGSAQAAGGQWTDSGAATDDRALKHRARRPREPLRRRPNASLS